MRPRWRSRRRSPRRWPCATSATRSSFALAARWSSRPLQARPPSNKLLPGDVITAVDGVATPKYKRLSALISRHRVGERVRITFIRDGRRAHRGASHRRLAVQAGRTVIGVSITPGGDDQAADRGHDRRRQRRRAVGRARLRARADRQAGSRHRSWSPGRGDRRARSSTAASIRSEESNRRSSARGAPESRSCSFPSGDNANEAKRYAGTYEDHSGNEFSTGVACPGNSRAEALGSVPFGNIESAANCGFFNFRNPCLSRTSPYHPGL